MAIVGELEFQGGDVIEIGAYRKIQDGYQNGKNVRTGKIGKFPLYKTKDVINTRN